MDFRTLAVLFWAGLLGTAALAGEKHRTRIEIAVDGDASGHQTFSFDSQDAGFDLDSMAIGETRTLSDISGNVADVRRTEDGYEFDVGGTTIDLKELHELDGVHGEHDIDIRIDGADSDLETSKSVKKIKIIKTTDVHGDSHSHDAHEVRIIKKEVDVTN